METENSVKCNFDMWSTNEIFDGQCPTDEIVYMNIITGKAHPLLDYTGSYFFLQNRYFFHKRWSDIIIYTK